MNKLGISVLLFCLYSVSFAFLMLCNNTEKYRKYYIHAKTLNSLSFILVAAISAKTADKLIFLYLLLPGFIFCFIGDFILGLYSKYNDRIYFLAGLFAFLSGHIAFVISLSTVLRFSYIDFIFPLIAVIITFGLCKLRHMDTGKMRIIILVYSFFVSLLFSKSMMIAGAFYSTSSLIFASGAALFLISDILILFLYFYRKKSPLVSIFNLGTYYYGMFLIAISLLF